MPSLATAVDLVSVASRTLTGTAASASASANATSTSSAANDGGLAALLIVPFVFVLWLWVGFLLCFHFNTVYSRSTWLTLLFSLPALFRRVFDSSATLNPRFINNIHNDTFTFGTRQIAISDDNLKTSYNLSYFTIFSQFLGNVLLCQCSSLSSKMGCWSM